MSDADIVARELKALLRRFPQPEAAERLEFLRAQHDLGLAWVHFEPGYGGLGIAASFQRSVTEQLVAVGAPRPGSGDYVGMHQAAASIDLRGLTFFVCDMTLPGIEIRPLRQADGDAHFSEVFLDGVRIADEFRLGDVGQGWAVSLTGLHSEREGIGEAVQTPWPDVAAAWQRYDPPGEAMADAMRQRVVACWVEARLLELSRARQLAAQGQRGSTPLGSLQKIAQSRANQRASSLLVDLMGPSGLIGFDYDVAIPEGHGSATLPQMQVVRSRANSIEGGTDEIQRNVIGEQVLGLPGDVRVDKNVPWRSVPRS